MFTQRVVKIVKVTFPKKDSDEVAFEFTDHSGWAGAKLKDFWKIRKWKDVLYAGVDIRLWTVQYSTVVGFEVWDEKRQEWAGVWCAANDFETEKERKKGDASYANFIKSEGKKIAKLIDAGKTLKEIDKLIDQGHSGNTYACALGIGISAAKDKKKAEAIRFSHNSKYTAGASNVKGTVNPAVVTIGERE